MSKAKIAPPPTRFAAAVPSPSRPAGAAVQRSTAVTFAATKKVVGRRTGEASELLSMPDGSFRLRSLDRGTLAPPSGTFNFVRVHGQTKNDAHLYASSQLPHASLAQGKPVIYAGTAKLESGRLEWWSNYSGTYQPIAEFRGQAKLPVEKFMPWQKLQMGGASMQRGTFNDRTAKAAPEGKKTERPAEAAKAAAATPGRSEAAKPAVPQTGRAAASPAASMAAPAKAAAGKA
jgi:hypothetical protein